MKKSVKQVNIVDQENRDVCCADGFPLRKRPGFLSLSLHSFRDAAFSSDLLSPDKQMKSNQEKKNRGIRHLRKHVILFFLLLMRGPMPWHRGARGCGVSPHYLLLSVAPYLSLYMLFISIFLREQF